MATETHEATAGACVDAGGSAIGMPQLCADWMPNQVFWLLVTLVAIYFILSRVALPRIASVLSERTGTITNDLGAAEELKERAAEAEGAYDKALADARAEAQAIVAKTKEDIQADLDVELQKADAEIAARTAQSEKAIAEIRDNAMSSVADVAKETAADLVVALGGKADKKAINAAVKARIGGAS